MTDDRPVHELIVHADPTTLAEAIAARFITSVIDAQARRGHAHVSLTGGRGGTSALTAIANNPAAAAVDWNAVDFWWSDERFEPFGDPQRNETDARTEFFAKLPIPESAIHPMPRLGEQFGDDVDAAAAGYAADLAQHGLGTDQLFDVSLLGIGEDAHIASLFPGRTEQFAEPAVVSVRNSPKPPPTRVTFTMETVRAARQVWLIAYGVGKADAVRKVMSRMDAIEAPAGAARGSERNLLLADRDAASGLG